MHGDIMKVCNLVCLYLSNLLASYHLVVGEESYPIAELLNNARKKLKQALDSHTLSSMVQLCPKCPVDSMMNSVKRHFKEQHGLKEVDMLETALPAPVYLFLIDDTQEKPRCGQPDCTDMFVFPTISFQ